MRGSDRATGSLFSYVHLEDRVPTGHPLRVILRLADDALSSLSPAFDEAYSQIGRPSLPPERLFRALLLQAFYSIRSERQLMERMDFDLLFRWFVGLGIDDPVWDASTTDPDARLYRKGPGQEARLCFIGSALMENRAGLVVDGRLTLATGRSETLSAIDLADGHVPARATLGADKAYDTKDFVTKLRERQITPHVAQNRYDTPKAKRRSAIDARTTRHEGYKHSQRIRKRIEEVFGWLKTVAGWRKSRFRGRERAEYGFRFALAAYNLTRLPKLLAT